MDLETITENKHKELLSLLNPLVDLHIWSESPLITQCGWDASDLLR